MEKKEFEFYVEVLVFFKDGSESTYIFESAEDINIDGVYSLLERVTPHLFSFEDVSLLYIDRQKQAKMVYVLDRGGSNVKVFTEKTALAKELGVSYSTVLRNLRSGNWIKDDFSVYARPLLPKKSARGGLRSRFWE